MRIAWLTFEARTSLFLIASGPYCFVLRQSAVHAAAIRRVAHIRTTHRRKLSPSDLTLRLLRTGDSRKQSIFPLLLRRIELRYQTLPPPCLRS